MITWNDQAELYLTPAERETVEQGHRPESFAGELRADEHGDVWWETGGGHRKHVGSLSDGKAAATERRPSRFRGDSKAPENKSPEGKSE